MKMKHVAACPLVLLASLFAVSTAAEPAIEVRYNRDVRPILSDACFRCHGPDAAARQSELRLDVEQDSVRDRDGTQAIRPGDADASEVIRRMTSDDPLIRMPPPESGDKLPAEKIQLIRQWIDEGARYEAHWSFLTPERPDLPAASEWTRNAIDHFVLARLRRHGVQPSVQADAETLVRRISLAVTGLPPTLREMDEFERAFAADDDAACTEYVDRLLKSPRYGEHMATAWLDAARYADTNGYFTDNDRSMWPWRDWVIQAFNRNVPFDQFTIEQLAGDLLPAASVTQRIATGFNRNHMVNNETGIVEEEFRVEYVVDRVDTTATVWMGLTLGCARCHDHKYDPVSQEEFYQFFAFFNNVPERGLSGSSGNAAPVLKVPAPDHQEKLQSLQEQITDLERQVAEHEEGLVAAQKLWEAGAGAEPEDCASHFALDELDEGANGTIPDGLIRTAAGMRQRSVQFSGNGALELRETGIAFDRDRPFTFSVWLNAESAGCIVSKMDDAAEMRGFDVTLRKGRAIVNLVHRWKRNAIQVVTESAVPMRSWHFLTVTWDGSGAAAGVRIYLDGSILPVTVTQDSLSGSIRNDEPVRLGRRASSASLKGRMDEVLFFNSALTPDAVDTLFGRQLVRCIVSRPAAARTKEQSSLLRKWFVSRHGAAGVRRLTEELDKRRAELSRLARASPTTMVMQEMAEPRAAVILKRGQYDQPAETVTAAVPSFLSVAAGFTPQPGRSANRLDLARWLVHPAHPLTARVTVNRLWLQVFGTGLVSTPADFGTQGDWPSHPELLDWLAVEFIESGWDVQHLLKLMVTSATFRQSSHGTEDRYVNDPQNRLLSRGPRFRMNAEMLRDNALAVSGLLVNHTGGPSVRPYQPDGLWKEVTYDNDSSYVAGQGTSLYRRSLYTFRKRQAPPPNMLLFDAPARETCVVQRSRTNTPLQALVLLNDPTFVEAARKLAERVLMEVQGTVDERIGRAFRLATARSPLPFETDVLRDVLQAELARMRSHPEAAASLLSVGRSPVDDSLDRTELAAWTIVASMILSLDETIHQR